VLANRLGHHAEVLVQDRHHRRGRHPFAEGSESLHVAEENGHRAALAAAAGQLRSIDQAVDDARIHVTAEGVTNVRFHPKLSDHVVELFGEPADFVAGGHGDHRVELSFPDGFGAVEEAMNGSYEAFGDDRREAQPEKAGNGRDQYADPHDSLLSSVSLRLGVRDDLEHVAADAVEILVEVVAQLVDRGQERANLSVIAPLEGIEELRDQLLIPTALLLVQLPEPGVEPGHRHHVVVAPRPFEALGELGSSKCDLFFTLPAEVTELFAERLTALRGGRRIGGGDHQPAQHEGSLQRAHVGTGDGGVARQVGIREELELVAQVARHLDHQQRRPRHQDEEPGGDREDLEADGVSDRPLPSRARGGGPGRRCGTHSRALTRQAGSVFHAELGPAKPTELSRDYVNSLKDCNESERPALNRSGAVL
jgi:hypothetical protein